MGRTYANNAANRSLGRAGMPMGSMVVSRSSGGGGSSAGSSYSASRSTSSRTYVDNSLNRSLGRVGMPHGSAVYSQSSTKPSVGSSTASSAKAERSPKVYVDNSLNRQLGRVGMPHGSMVHSKSPSASSSASPSKGGVKVYVDNSMNRALGRVGMPHGSMVGSKSGAITSKPTPVYVDNPYNRRLGRVGMPLGSMSISNPAIRDKLVYADTATNRAKGRVGQPWTSLGVTDGYQELLRDRRDEISRDLAVFRDTMLSYLAADAQDRRDEVEAMRALADANRRLQDVPDEEDVAMAADEFRGGVVEIPADHLDYTDDKAALIGAGSFGQVYKGTFYVDGCPEKGLPVAIKTITAGVTRRSYQDTVNELKVHTALAHTNVVRLYGIHVDMERRTMNLVMDLCANSLDDDLHGFKPEQFTAKDKMHILRQVAGGMGHLHDNGIIHRDLKPANILMKHTPPPAASDERYWALVSDFGLSVITSAATTASSPDMAGTWRYMAPEVLGGKDATKEADVFAFGIVAWELMAEEEPWYGLNAVQVQHKVCGGETPDLDRIEDSELKVLVKSCLRMDHELRPTFEEIEEKMIDLCFY
ncbi:Protein kinase domain [Carpediemonas membranifera]|uniref:Protein kinase domain n=1 Tax=Carpediemonas membranifera TaxID=201153 RepID=A0A8J6E1F3_9EUKA|nr:Protein kinase domain [Carpediemonas membranifera]|eukprot:KAG9396279.1 Protein kinase domain [Carpediemonas membranifera]